MGNTIFAQAAQFLYDRRDKRRWQIAVCCLAALVIFGTTWALIRQGKALMSSEENILDCKYEVHKHSADCYEDGRLACGKVEYVVHTHGDSCYDEDGELVCLLPETEGHVHDASCFVTEEILVCGLDESVADSYMEEEPSDEQEGPSEGYVQEVELTCDQEEHSHTDDCYEVEVSEERILTCDQEEQPEHSHADDCYDVDEETGEETLVCGQEEQTGHSHTDGCYEVETSEERILTCEQEEHTHFDDCYDSVLQDMDSVQNEPEAEGTVATDDTVADVAVGHTHSVDCYQLVRRLACGEEGVHVHDADCYQNDALICTAPEVNSLEEHVHDSECFTTVESEKYTQIFMNSDIKVTVTYGASSGIPEDVRMDVEQITNGEHYENRLAELEGTNGALENDEELAMLLGFGFEKLDERFVPKNTVSLTVQFLNDSIYAEGDEVVVACFGENGINLIPGMYIDADGSVTFDVDNLSELAFIAPIEKFAARTLVYEGEDYIVTVGLDEDSAVPEDAELVVNKIDQEDSKSYEEYFERLSNADALEDNEMLAMLLDMKIYAEDQEIVPDESMKVRVQFLNREIYFEGDAVKAAYITADDIELLEAADINNEISTTFTVDELAGVAFIKDSDIRTMIAEGEDYVVTVRFDSKAMIPEDAEFVAVRITPESDPERFAAREEQAQAEVEGEIVVVEALFNIGFYDADGAEIEPQSTVDVRIQLLDRSEDETSDSFKVIHFATDEESEDENIEIIEDADVSNDEEGSMSTTFQLGSFSDVALIATSTKVNSEATLRSKIGSATAGDTIQLDADFPFTGAAIAISKKITLDLNGHTIMVSGSRSVFSIGAGGDLTITDLSIGSTDGLVKSNDRLESTVGRSTDKVTQRNKQLSRANSVSYQTNGYKLTSVSFDVTEASKIDKLTGITEETTWTYTLTGHGAIVGSDSNTNPLIAISSSGKLTLEGGVVLARNKGRAIKAVGDTSSVINLKDCYLVGNGNMVTDITDDGGAIYLLNGTLNIGEKDKDNVIPIISGNKAMRGGGVYTQTAKVNVYGGYITNNYSNQYDMMGKTGYKNTYNSDGYNFNKDLGGGGGLLILESTFKMWGGYVTGNVSRRGGAGIAFEARGKGYSRAAVDATIKGGYILSNFCVSSERGGRTSDSGTAGEGAGIAVYGYYSDHAVTLTIKPEEGKNVYINNNWLTGSKDWGGGGLFVSQYAVVDIHEAVISDNIADGFGGGLAGCPSGEVLMSGNEYAITDEGIAIFYNKANNHTVSGTTSSEGAFKGLDRKLIDPTEETYRKYNAKFFRTEYFEGEDGELYSEGNYYQDVFAAKNMILYDWMLGGGRENWKGMADETLINGGADYVASTAIMGLTAYPVYDNSDIDPIQAAREAAHVFITGNFSSVHGGGIMCNGVLSLGELPKELDKITSLDLTADKAFVAEVSNAPVDMQKGQFEFGIYKEPEKKAEDSNKEVKESDLVLISTASNGESGTIKFKTLYFDLSRKGIAAGGKETFTYYIKELPNKEDEEGVPNVIMDSSVYKLDVTVKRTDNGYLGLSKTTKVYIDTITNVKLTKLDKYGKDANVIFTRDYSINDKNTTNTIKLSGSKTGDNVPLFTNVQRKLIDIEVRKEWDTSINVSEIDYIEVTLKRYDEDTQTYVEVTEDELPKNESVTKVLQAAPGDPDNDWRATWKNLDGKYRYTVEETKVVKNGKDIDPNYLYTQIIEGDGTETIKITNVPKMFDIEITKTNFSGTPLNNVKFKIYENNSTEPLRFVVSKSDTTQQDIYTVWHEGKSREPEEETVDELLIGENIANGSLLIFGLSASADVKYTIEESEPPIGYSKITPFTIQIIVDEKGDNPPKLEVSCIRGEDCDEHVADYNEGNKAVLKLTIKDPDYKYELPETGGIGNAHTGILAVMMVFVVAAIMYTTYQRRKGD